jgi:hypothetical protein
MIEKNKHNVFLFTVIVVLVCLFSYFFCCQHDISENTGKYKLGLFLSSRILSGKVEAYNEKITIDSPWIFIFTKSRLNVDKMINYLGLVESKSLLPIPFADVNRVIYANKLGDDFLNNSKTYVAYYCDDYGVDWEFDAVIIGKDKVAYVTSGYFRAVDYKMVDDPSRCRMKQQ